jgi:uncharacterized protein YkwD
LLGPLSGGAPAEQGLLEELNALRSDPQRWVAYLEQRKKWFQGAVIREPGQTPIRTQEGVRAVDEAIAVLRAQRPVRPLKFSAELAHAARDHVRDIGPLGSVTHVGSNGSSTRTRVERYLPNVRTLGEVINFGPGDTRAVIAELLVDDGVPLRGHRKILLDPAYRLAGAACGPHKLYGTVCVIDVATGR